MFWRSITSAAVIAATLGAAVVGAGSPALAGEPTGKAADLTILYQQDRDANQVSWKLVCPDGRGDHPNAAAACAKLETLTGDPFAEIPPQTFCTQQWGGPQTARINGTWGTRVVDARFSLTNGCQISRWRKLIPVLPAPLTPTAPAPAA